jgi:hypothetical protein
MLSEETLNEYRGMSLSEKLALVLRMIDDETPYLLTGASEVVDRRFELLRRENDLRNQAMLEAIALTRLNHDRP